MHSFINCITSEKDFPHRFRVMEVFLIIEYVPME